MNEAIDLLVNKLNGLMPRVAIVLGIQQTEVDFVLPFLRGPGEVQTEGDGLRVGVAAGLDETEFAVAGPAVFRIVLCQCGAGDHQQQ